MPPPEVSDSFLSLFQYFLFILDDISFGLLPPPLSPPLPLLSSPFRSPPPSPFPPPRHYALTGQTCLLSFSPPLPSPPSLPWSFSLAFSRLHVIPRLIPEIPALLSLQTNGAPGRRRGSRKRTEKKRKVRERKNKKKPKHRVILRIISHCSTCLLLCPAVSPGKILQVFYSVCACVFFFLSF